MTGTFSYFETGEFIGVAAPAVSPAGRGRIYFDSGDNTFKQSANGAAYAALASGFSLALPAAGYESVQAGAPELIDRNNHKLIGLAKGEGIYLKCRLPPNYNAAANLTATLTGIAASATTGDVIGRLAFDYLAAGVGSFTTSSFATSVDSTAVAAAGTLGLSFATTFTLSNANLDLAVAGGLIQIQVIYANVAGSTMVGDWQIQDLVLSQ